VRITTDLVRRFEPRIPRRTGDLQAYLVAVFADEQRKRRSRFAPRAKAVPPAASPSRRGVSCRRNGTPGRHFARRRSGWSGLESGRWRRGDSRVRGPYAKWAADLARARTYQVDPRVITYLERVVTAGHNAL